MAKTCPKLPVNDLRALVEDTLDADRVADVRRHVEGCSSCRKLRSKLEKEERSIRAGIAAEGNTFGLADAGDDAAEDECPSPAELAAYSERSLDGELLARLENHVARCGLCRGSSVVASQSYNSDLPRVEVSDETLAAARRRLAVARAESDAASEGSARGDSSRRKTSGRRGTRTGRYAPVAVMPGSRTGLFIAAAAALFLTLGLIAILVSSSPSPDGQDTAQNPKPPVAPPAPTPAPQNAPKPVEAPRAVTPTPGGPDDVVAVAPKPVEVASDPIDEPLPQATEQPQDQDGPQAPRGIRPANSGKTSQGTGGTRQGDPGANEPAAAPKGPVAPKNPTPVTPVGPEGPKAAPGEFCSMVESISGPVEIQKKGLPTWRKLQISDIVQNGDGLRSRGEDGGVVLPKRAHVTFSAESQGTVSFTATGVTVELLQGSLSGEALAYAGLLVTNENGTFSSWKGSKIRSEARETGLWLKCEAGKASAENTHGKTVVRAGCELTLKKGAKPAEPTSSGGDNDKKGASAPRGK
jgi:hypothetical protein